MWCAGAAPGSAARCPRWPEILRTTGRQARSGCSAMYNPCKRGPIRAPGGGGSRRAHLPLPEAAGIRSWLCRFCAQRAEDVLLPDQVRDRLPVFREAVPVFRDAWARRPEPCAGRIRRRGMLAASASAFGSTGHRASQRLGRHWAIGRPCFLLLGQEVALLASFLDRIEPRRAGCKMSRCPPLVERSLIHQPRRGGRVQKP